MDTEKLKVIAEGMGYKEIAIIAGHWFMCEESDGSKTEYNPLTNNDQMVEIIKKLLDINMIIEFEYLSTKQFWATLDGKQYGGKTINEAVCNAAYEYFKNKGEL